MKKIFLSLLVCTLVISVFVNSFAQITPASQKPVVKTIRPIYDAEFVILKQNDRICVIINPTSLLPTTSDHLIIDYKVTDTSATVNAVIQGMAYP